MIQRPRNRNLQYIWKQTVQFRPLFVVVVVVVAAAAAAVVVYG